MGTGESGTPAKATTTAVGQEQPCTPTSYADWATAIQAYYANGTNPPSSYFPSVTSGSQPHPCMWGGQPLMAPPPYAVYNPGGIYGYPSMPPGSLTYGQYGVPSPGGSTDATAVCPSVGTEGDSRTVEGRENLLVKRERMRGSLCPLSEKGCEDGKESLSDDVFSQSAESGSEGSSDGSEEADHEDGLQKPHKRSVQMSSDATGEQCTTSGRQCSEIPVLTSQSGDAYVTSEGHTVRHPANQSSSDSQTIMTLMPGKAVLPTTNLNIGMDYWNGSTSESIPAGKGRSKAMGGPGAVVPVTSSALVSQSHDGAPPELWLQDERELKRQRRKQANRESARRSRLRKQAEYEELAARVDALSNENASLRLEVNRLSELCRDLSSENHSLQEQVHKVHCVTGDLNIHANNELDLEENMHKQSA